VQRVNVVEPDGTLRMIISNHAKLPGIIVRGKEERFDRPQAGLLFYNDVGSENGGLIFGGRRNAKGEVVGVDDKEDRFAGLIVSDTALGGDGHRRAWFGRGEDGSAALALMDAEGRKRIVMEVSQNGSPQISVLDANWQSRETNGSRKRKVKCYLRLR